MACICTNTSPVCSMCLIVARYVEEYWKSALKGQAPLVTWLRSTNRVRSNFTAISRRNWRSLVSSTSFTERCQFCIDPHMTEMCTFDFVPIICDDAEGNVFYFDRLGKNAPLFTIGKWCHCDLLISVEFYFCAAILADNYLICPSRNEESASIINWVSLLWNSRRIRRLGHEKHE